MKVTLLLALSLAAALAQTPPSRDREGAVASPQERGKRAIDETLAALGGDRFLAVQDRTESGRAYSFYR